MKRFTGAAMAAIVVSCGSASAQTGSWVDPPPDDQAPPPVAAQTMPNINSSTPVPWVQPPPLSGAAPQTPLPATAPAAADAAAEATHVAGADPREAQAGAFAQTYLRTWSGLDTVGPADVSAFYADRVLFYGQVVDQAGLLAQKRRFLERWPERSYRPHPESLHAACNDSQGTCRVRVLFDYEAAARDEARRSSGLALLDLTVRFADRRPAITAESSRVIGRGETALDLPSRPVE